MQAWRPSSSGQGALGFRAAVCFKASPLSREKQSPENALAGFLDALSQCSPAALAAAQALLLSHGLFSGWGPAATSSPAHGCFRHSYLHLQDCQSLLTQQCPHVQDWHQEKSVPIPRQAMALLEGRWSWKLCLLFSNFTTSSVVHRLWHQSAQCDPGDKLLHSNVTELGPCRVTYPKHGTGARKKPACILLP